MSIHPRGPILRQRFNLVELVLVLTVLASIVSLLLPVVYRSGLNAKSVLCSSNQSRLGKWLQLYANDSDYYFPAYEDGWTTLLAKAGGVNFALDAEPEGEFGCPSQPFESLSASQSPTEYWRGTHYGINQHIASKLVDQYDRSYAEWHQVRTQRISDPSRKVALADASGGNFFGMTDHDNTVTGFALEGGTYADAFPPTPVRAFPYLRHIDGTTNFLFVDGHVGVKKSWPRFMSGRGTSGYDFWHGEHTAGIKHEKETDSSSTTNAGGTSKSRGR